MGFHPEREKKNENKSGRGKKKKKKTKFWAVWRRVFWWRGGGLGQGGSGAGGCPHRHTDTQHTKHTQHTTHTPHTHGHHIGQRIGQRIGPKWIGPNWIWPKPCWPKLDSPKLFKSGWPKTDWPKSVSASQLPDLLPNELLELLTFVAPGSAAAAATESSSSRVGKRTRNTEFSGEERSAFELDLRVKGMPHNVIFKNEGQRKEKLEKLKIRSGTKSIRDDLGTKGDMIFSEKSSHVIDKMDNLKFIELRQVSRIVGCFSYCLNDLSGDALLFL